MTDTKRECEDAMVEEYMLDNPAYRQLADESRDHGRPDWIRESNERAARIRARSTTTPRRVCAHPDGDATHGAVARWANTWAEVLRVGAPSKAEEWGDHEMHALTAREMRREEIVASAPAEFSGCARATPLRVDDAILYGPLS